MKNYIKQFASFWLRKLKQWVKSYPSLFNFITGILIRYPKLRNIINGFYYTTRIPVQPNNCHQKLLPSAKDTHTQLLDKINAMKDV